MDRTGTHGTICGADKVNCLNCKHFSEAAETCALSQGMRPPARVIVFGCPAYKNTTDEVLEQHVRSGNLDFSAKPRPAHASIPASIPASVVRIEKSQIAKNLSEWDRDIPF